MANTDKNLNSRWFGGGEDLSKVNVENMKLWWRIKASERVEGTSM